LSSQSPIEVRVAERLMAPSIANIWGTDDLGRDVLARALHGFSRTVRVSLGALLSSLIIGIFLGGLAGYVYRSALDWAFNWLVSLIVSLPFLLIMASILSLTRPTLEKAYVILTCIMWVNPARLV